VKHYGDVSKISGSQIEPVDIITFGSPCQDLSVAGKREGMKHAEQGNEETTRSGLFYEAIRIIEEMREATNGEYPKYAVWENVPGAFSSNKGRDFHAVLEAFCSVCDDTVSIPEPYDRKRTKLIWNKAGEIVGVNYSVAWRTLDAQYWGVPQRRKRIYLVADFTGRRAGEILFKPDSLRGHMSQGDEAGQGVTADAVGGIDGGVGVIVLNDQGGSSINVESENLSPTLRANSHSHEPVIALQANGIDRADTAGCNGCGWRENESYTLNTIDRHAVCYDARNHNAQEISGTIQAKPNGGQSLNYVNPVCYDARGNGDGNLSPTITGDHQNGIMDDTAVAVFEPKSALDENWGEANVKNALRAGASKSSHAVVQETKPPRKYIIRRLTPTECARLQGFPDNWGQLAPYDPADAEFWEDVRKTHAEINGKKYKPVKDIKKWYDKLHTDSAEYKMWGNGIALPNAEYVIRGIAEQGAKTLGSLFDGSGGFPLAGVMNGIKPLWASEVEPYPIAVTKSRFEGVTMW
jgi:DNA (cytosine-5)-methyltransferase 1